MRREMKNLNTAFHSCAAQVTKMEPTECPQPKKRFFKLPGKFSRNKKDMDDDTTRDRGADILPLEYKTAADG